MMREFRSFLEAALYIGETVVRRTEEQSAAMERVGKVIEAEAKALIGDYQDAAGPFVAWAELADSTKAEKQALGYGGQVSEDDPLLRTGAMRDSIEHRSDRDMAVIGSDSDIAVYQELGTAEMPPRSFLGAAAVHKSEEVKRIIGESVVTALVGEKVFGGAMDL